VVVGWLWLLSMFVVCVRAWDNVAKVIISFSGSRHDQCIVVGIVVGDVEKRASDFYLLLLVVTWETFFPRVFGSHNN
jgi:hypothetical protein